MARAWILVAKDSTGGQQFPQAAHDKATAHIPRLLLKNRGGSPLTGFNSANSMRMTMAVPTTNSGG